MVSARGLVDHILREEPQLDVLINNAGVFAMADPHPDALDPAKVAQMMDALEGLVAKLSG